jgi:hypothetical protein
VEIIIGMELGDTLPGVMDSRPSSVMLIAMLYLQRVKTEECKPRLTVIRLMNP